MAFPLSFSLVIICISQRTTCALFHHPHHIITIHSFGLGESLGQLHLHIRLWRSACSGDGEKYFRRPHFAFIRCFQGLPTIVHPTDPRCTACTRHNHKSCSYFSSHLPMLIDRAITSRSRRSGLRAASSYVRHNSAKSCTEGSVSTNSCRVGVVCRTIDRAEASFVAGPASPKTCNNPCLTDEGALLRLTLPF